LQLAQVVLLSGHEHNTFCPAVCGDSGLCLSNPSFGNALNVDAVLLVLLIKFDFSGKSASFSTPPRFSFVSRCPPLFSSLIHDNPPLIRVIQYFIPAPSVAKLAA
jgi:hypothetical protein